MLSSIPTCEKGMLAPNQHRNRQTINKTQPNTNTNTNPTHNPQQATMDLVAGVRKEGSRYVTPPTRTLPLPCTAKKNLKLTPTRQFPAAAAPTSNGKTCKATSTAKTTSATRSWPVRLPLSFLLSYPCPSHPSPRFPPLSHPTPHTHPRTPSQISH